MISVSFFKCLIVRATNLLSMLIASGFLLFDFYIQSDVRLAALFDRDNEEIDAFDIKLNENFLLTDFSEADEEILEIDLLEYIKDNDGTIAGRRFWGWTCGIQNCYPVDGEEQCFRRCCYHIIWFQNQCEDRNVNDLLGSNPVLINP